MGAVLALVLALCAFAHAQPVPTCQSLTRKEGCSECRRGTCLFCAKGFGETWTGTGASLQVSQCTRGRTSGCNDPMCARCVNNPPTCVECKTTSTSVGPIRVNNVNIPPVPVSRYSHYLNWASGPKFGKCVPARPAVITGNTNCLEWNPDGSCTLCRNWNVNGALAGLVVPHNAIYTNGINPMSTCQTRLSVGTMSLAAVGKDMVKNSQWIPAECVEVGSDFRCQRCRNGLSIATTASSAKCVAPTKAQSSAKKNANGCYTSLPYQQYCIQCEPNGIRCKPGLCVAGRSPYPAGICSLPCKQLFGITCLKCNNDRCLANDPAFPNGRR